MSASYTTYCGREREPDLASDLWLFSSYGHVGNILHQVLSQIQEASNLWASNYRLYYPTINTYNYATAGNIYDLEQHELTTGTNVPIYSGIHTKGEHEKSKYILMVLPSRIMSSIWPTYQFFKNNFEVKIYHGKHNKNGTKYLFFRRLALVKYKLSMK